MLIAVVYVLSFAEFFDIKYVAVARKVTEL